MSAQPEALRLAAELEACPSINYKAHAAELRRLHSERARLRTVMVAAAEEIAEHWAAHCDAEGYGPASLMHRLEEGIAAEYGYTAGDFARLRAENEALKRSVALLQQHHATAWNRGHTMGMRANEDTARRALDAVKQDAWGNTQLTEALLRAEAQRDALLEALKAILRDPSGCVFCDSGKPRKSVLTGNFCEHDDRCGFLLARAAIKAVEGEA